MSQNEEKRKYRIDIGAYGSIGIEAQQRKNASNYSKKSQKQNVTKE
jgi:hypothetical protein